MAQLRQYVGEADVAVPESDAGISPRRRSGDAADMGDMRGAHSDCDAQQGASSEDDHGAACNGAKRQREKERSQPAAAPGEVVCRGRLTGVAWASFLEQQSGAMAVQL